MIYNKDQKAYEQKLTTKSGGLAQLARASALHAEGQRFESVILHNTFFKNKY
jgi:hypothetical protein